MDSRTTPTISSGHNPTLMHRDGRFCRLPGCLGQISRYRPLKCRLELALVESGRKTETVAELHKLLYGNR